jgi:hypothetical protein
MTNLTIDFRANQGGAMILKLWREVEFKIVEDCGSRFVLDTDFHLAKVMLPDGKARFASFEANQFDRLRSRDEWIKAAVCYPVFDAVGGTFAPHPIGEHSENAVVSLSICPLYMHGPESQSEWSNYQRILYQGNSQGRNLLSRIVGILCPNII